MELNLSSLVETLKLWYWIFLILSTIFVAIFFFIKNKGMAKLKNIITKIRAKYHDEGDDFRTVRVFSKWAASIDKSRVTFDVAYSREGKVTHKVVETWTATDLFCPRCRKQTLYFNEDCDFYRGDAYTHICISCKYKFDLSYDGNCSGEDDQRLIFLTPQRLP